MLVTCKVAQQMIKSALDPLKMSRRLKSRQMQLDNAERPLEQACYKLWDLFTVIVLCSAFLYKLLAEE